MTQVENQEVGRYKKNKKYCDWQDKILQNYKDKEKIEDDNGIISTFVNEKKKMSILKLK